MNKERRKKLNIAKTLLDQARDIIDDIKFDEECAFDNLSEGLQQTMRGEQMEENVSEMEDAIDKIDEAMDCLDSVD